MNPMRSLPSLLESLLAAVQAAIPNIEIRAIFEKVRGTTASYYLHPAPEAVYGSRDRKVKVLFGIYEPVK